MSKTIELQVEKSRVLIEGLSKNVAELGDKGIRQEELDVMSGRTCGTRKGKRGVRRHPRGTHGKGKGSEHETPCSKG